MISETDDIKETIQQILSTSKNNMLDEPTLMFAVALKHKIDFDHNLLDAIKKHILKATPKSTHEPITLDVNDFYLEEFDAEGTI